MSSNDYLGLNADISLREEFFLTAGQELKNIAFSASSSRLLTGNHPEYRELEDKLSRLYRNRAACVLNSGYHTNIGLLQALTGTRDLILSDKINHASIIDGLKLSAATFKRFPHLDYSRLEEMLSENRRQYENVFIVTESVFSMDGDIANLPKLVFLKKKYNAVLVVDEAHAVGVFGPSGTGACGEFHLINDIDIIIGTLGKAFASLGAYVICAPLIKEYLINKMRPLIYTTALPPLCVKWSSFIIDKAAKMEEKRAYLHKLSQKLRSALLEKGCHTCGCSQIVPLITGDNKAAVDLAEKLQKKGFIVFPIRPPTVPPNTTRIRFSLNAALSENHIDRILAAL